MTDGELAGAIRAIGVKLQADRCWLYVRDPARCRGIAAIRWLRHDDTTDVPADLRAWALEAPDLQAIDPLFARALAAVPLDSVDDTTRDGCNQALERALGHRAFLHLNLQLDGVLWGTLQPGMTAAPRHWSERDRAVVLGWRGSLAEAIRAIVVKRGDELVSRRFVG